MDGTDSSSSERQCDGDVATIAAIQAYQKYLSDDVYHSAISTLNRCRPLDTFDTGKWTEDFGREYARFKDGSNDPERSRASVLELLDKLDSTLHERAQVCSQLQTRESLSATPGVGVSEPNTTRFRDVIDGIAFSRRYSSFAARVFQKNVGEEDIVTALKETLDCAARCTEYDVLIDSAREKAVKTVRERQASRGLEVMVPASPTPSYEHLRDKWTGEIQEARRIIETRTKHALLDK